MRQGRHQDAISLANDVLAGIRLLGRRDLVAQCHLLLSSVYFRMGVYAEAKSHAEAAIYHYTWEVEDDEKCGCAYDFLGLACKNLGLWRDAETNFRAALHRYQLCGAADRTLLTSLNLAIVLRKMGKMSEAIAILRQGLSIANRPRNELQICRYSLELANIAVIKRDAEEARRHCEAAAKIADTHDYRRERVLAKEIEGDIACVDKDYEASIRLYKQGLTEARRFGGGSDLEYELLGRVARAYLAMHESEKAREAAEAAIELASSCGDTYEHALSLRTLGEIEILEGRSGCGIDHLRQSLGMLLSLSAWSHETALAKLTLGRGRGRYKKCAGEV